MKKVVMFLCALVAGCTTFNSVAPQPETIVRMTITPALTPLSNTFSACLPDQTQSAVFIDESVQANLPPDSALVVALGEPLIDYGFITPLAEEEIVIVVHPSNQVGWGAATWQAVFKGARKSWQDDRPIQVWTLLDADETTYHFIRDLLNNSPISPNALIAPSPASLRAEIANDPNAVGFLPRAWLNDTVRGIGIGLQYPILAFAPGDIPDVLTNALTCLQGVQGQGIIATLYTPLDIP